MLDPQMYKSNEKLAKSLIPSWRVSQPHNLDHFEKAGFPVRISSYAELGQILDTMQEKRFDKYMQELGGLSVDEFDEIIQVCLSFVKFQIVHFPYIKPILPISTLLSVFVLKKKIFSANQNTKSILEIGPGCGYISFFLEKIHSLSDYSQIEACESFYILQNLVNVHIFGSHFNEMAMQRNALPIVDFFMNERADSEFSPKLNLGKINYKANHYPWWWIGELLSSSKKYDVVTSNANLLEFNGNALDDYLSLIHEVLEPEGIFLVQCTGYPANGSVESLMNKLYEKEFAPLFFVKEGEKIKAPNIAKKTNQNNPKDYYMDCTVFTTNNVLMVKNSHPLFKKYYNLNNYHFGFVADENIIADIYFKRKLDSRQYTIQNFVESTQVAFSKI